MVLVPKQIYKPRKQNRGLRNNAIEVMLHIYNHLIFDKSDKNKQWIPYLINGVGNTSQPYAEN